MPVPLVYDIAVTGQDRLKRAMRGIESEAKASASRVTTESRRSTTARGTGDPRAREAARGFDQIGRAARAADARVIRERMAAERRANAERLRQISNEEKAGIRAAERAAEARKRTAERIGRGFAGAVGGSVKKVVGIGANALALGGGLLGGIGAAGAVESEIELRGKASELANQARRPEIKGDLAREAKGLQGFTGMQALGALEQFTNITGDLDTARQLLPELGKLALATNADIGELAATAGNAFIPLSDQVKDPTERLRQMKDVMAALAGQGAVGAVEIKQLATYFAGLAATSNRFVGDKAGLLKTMGAITQAARQRGGAADAAEAVTATERFSSDVITKSAKLAKIGVDVFSDKSHTQLADPQEIITRVLEKTKGDLTKVGDIFGERGIRAIQGFSPLFVEAEKRKPGNGREAVAAEFKRLLSAQFSSADIERGAKSRLADDDKQLQESVKRFNDAVGTRLLPVLERLIPKFEEMIPKIADVAGVLADFASNVINNPIPNIGLLIAGKVAADLASAAIGEVVAAGMAKLFALAAGSNAIGGAASALGAGANLAGGALGLGAAGAGALATGAAAGAAVLGVGAAAYEGVQLNSDIDKLKSEEGNQGKGFWEIMSKGPSQGTSRAEYDRLYGPGGKFSPATPAAAPAQGKQMDADKVGKQIGETAGNAIAAKLAGVQLATNAPNPRRTNPIIDR